VPAEADRNPYLFRSQEISLAQSGKQPLSTVRDMIGSQSTKGIHFLNRLGSSAHSQGTWSTGAITAIETYPAAALADPEVARLTNGLVRELTKGANACKGAPWWSDVRDALACSVVAMLHRLDQGKLEPPGVQGDKAEGWIWLPKRSPASALSQ
jgi:hypothetical protein